MKCPFCKLEFRSNHIYTCKLKPDIIKDELKIKSLEYNYPEFATYDNLIENYVNKKMSLPDIYKKYGIDYNSIKFLLKYYNIPIRSNSEGAINSMCKREKTNIERYGVKNVLTKGTEQYNKRNKTVKEKYGVDNVFQIKEVVDRINDDTHYLEKYGLTKKELASFNSKIMWNKMSEEEKKIFLEKSNEKKNKTFIEKYGGHPINNSFIKSKIIETNNKKYGCDYYFQNKNFLNNSDIKNKISVKKIQNGFKIADNLLEPFNLYKRKCRNLTNKVKNILFNNWDGYDYYDSEYIKENLKLHNTNKKYPTIDHKISIYYGFANNITEEEICDINNLCITKRSINCSKRSKNSI